MRFQTPKGDHKISCASLTPLGRVFKIHDFPRMIFDSFIKNFHAPASPR